MPRYGTIVRLSELHLIVLFLAVAFFVSGAWATCTTGSYSVSKADAYRCVFNGTCQYGAPADWQDRYPYCNEISIDCNLSCCASTFTYGGGTYYSGVYWPNEPGQCETHGSYGTRYTEYRNCYYTTACTSQAEADSVACVNNPTAEGCVEADVPPECESDYEQCVTQLHGVWRKVGVTGGECSSECDMCGSSAITKNMNGINRICCEKGMAPPDSVSQCYTPAQTGPGMSWSVYRDKTNNYECGALSTSDGEGIQENQSLYQKFCIDGEEYQEQVDTNDAPGGGEGDSSSSGEGGGTQSSPSFGTELEALGGLYGVLDTIRDTIVKRLTPATEAILNCLQNAQLCMGLSASSGDTTIVNFESVFDTSLRDSMHKFITSVSRLDSSVKHSSDTTKKYIDALNDSSRKYLRSSKVVQDSILHGLLGNGTSDSGVLGAIKGSLDGIEGLIDTAFNGKGVSVLDTSHMFDGYGTDSAGYGSVLDSIYGVNGGDGISVDSAYADSATCETDSCYNASLNGYEDSLAVRLKENIDSSYTALNDTLHSYFDTLRNEFMLVNFDSLILQPLGLRVPNTNECPEGCFQGVLPAGTIKGVNTNINIDYKVCQPYTAFAGNNVLMFIRILLRILTAISCVYIGMWFMAGKK